MSNEMVQGPKDRGEFTDYKSMLKPDNKDGAETQPSADPVEVIQENLVSIADRLKASGLEEDAKILKSQSERLDTVINAIAKFLKDNPDELKWFSGDGKTDDARLTQIIKQAYPDVLDNSIGTGGISILDQSYGEAARVDRKGTWYSPEQVEQYSDQINQNGGLMPVLSDEGLRIILEDKGLIKIGEDTKDLEPWHAYRSAEDGSGQTLFYRYDLDVNGNIKNRNLAISFKPGFLIQAAVRRSGETSPSQT